MKQTNFIRQANATLNRYRQILREAYGDETLMKRPNGMQASAQEYDEEGYGEAANGYGMQDGGMSEDEAASPMEQVDTEVTSVIDQIRELAIKGIAQYADDIESEQYQALKKIWLLTDKFYEDLNGDENNKK